MISALQCTQPCVFPTSALVNPLIFCSMMKVGRERHTAKAEAARSMLSHRKVCPLSKTSTGGTNQTECCSNKYLIENTACVQSKLQHVVKNSCTGLHAHFSSHTSPKRQLKAMLRDRD